MEFTKTRLPGVYDINLEFLEDDRGYFVRCWDSNAFGEQVPNLMQWSLSHNKKPFTLRGLHWQASPHCETKLVRCLRGKIWDVAVDIRPESPTFLSWHGSYLCSERLNALYIPEGFAHGFITLEENSLVQYGISGKFHAPSGRGMRWDDPAIGISWPAEPEVLSERDRSYPLIDK